MAETKYTRSCEVCGADISHKRAGTRACSKKCSTKAYVTFPKYKCECKGCGVTFLAKQRHYTAFCSSACGNKNRDKLKKELEALVRIAERPSIDLATPVAVRLEIQAIKRIWTRSKQTERAKAGDRRIKRCAHCGKLFVVVVKDSGRDVKYCSESCERDKHRDARRAANKLWKKTPAGRSSRASCNAKRRARIRGAHCETVSVYKVFERDKWRCHLCGVKTPEALRGSCEPNAPELDHIVSLAEGGAHTYANVACSCRKCNGEKGAKSLGQPGLLDGREWNGVTANQMA